MKVKRLKKARKKLSVYINNFGLHEPYQILVDGTFCQAALDCRIHIKEQLPKYLSGEIKLLSTACIVHELDALGEEFLGAKLIAKRFQARKCKHFGKPVPAAECVASLVGGHNKDRFVVATQDQTLKRAFAKIPGIPILSITHNCIILEPPSRATLDAVDMHKAKALAIPEHERKALERRRKSEAGAAAGAAGAAPLDSALPAAAPAGVARPPPPPGSRKRKKAGGPNPLSVKKKKKNKSQQPGGGVDKKLAAAAPAN